MSDDRLLAESREAMIGAPLALFLALAGACDGTLSNQVPPTRGAPKPGNNLLFVDAEQIASNSNVDFRVTIVNVNADRSVWINARPRVGTGSFRVRDTEIDLSIMDARRRMVKDLCEALPAIPDRSHFVNVKPKQKVVVSVELDPRCYSLAPGEKLLMQLTYAATNDWPKLDPVVLVPFEAVGLKDWKKVVVPDGWKDTATPPPL